MQMRSFPPRRLPIAAALVMAAAFPARADIYSVGTDGCSHATIQQAVDAAEANPGPDFIRVPHSQVWTDQAIVIDTAQTLWFEGYWSDCNTIDDSVHTTLDGAGGSAAPVIRINAATGSVIGFDFIDIRNGDASGDNGKGGGIWYRGNGTLSIRNGSIYNNTAGLGGGLYLEGTGESAAVTIGANVGMTGNVARDSGGGVFAEAVHFYMLEPNSIIAFNEATGYELLGAPVGGYGGGLVVNNTNTLHAYATIGSAGVGSAGAIHGNTARYGGGVAVRGEEGGGANSYLSVRATLDGIPAKLSGNFASVAGGGLYLSGYSGHVSSAHATLWNASIEGNAAADGAAAYVATVASLSFNGSGAPDAACPMDAPCGSIVDNIDQNAAGERTGGAVIEVHGQLDLGAPFEPDSAPAGRRGIAIERNRGGRLIDLEGAPFSGSSLIISGNEVSQQLIRTTSNGDGFNMSDSTIVANAIGGDAVFEVDSDDATMRRLLIWQPGTLSLDGDAAPNVQWTLASEAASLGGGPGAVAISSPRFIDPDRGDYRLRAASPAIDYAMPIAGDDRDAFGLPRDQDLPAALMFDGYVRDVGAFERQTLLPLLYNGDFTGDANLWFLLPGHAGTYQIDNAPGSPDGSGSAQVAGTSNEGRLLGYLQCIHLPGPGTYALNGSARSEGDPQLSNPTALIWELRLDGGEGCIDGAITTGGTHALGTQATTDQWIRPANPALISVTESEWNHNTSLTVLMAVYPNASGNAYNGLFDRITLEWSADGNDVIFADGFDDR